MKHRVINPLYQDYQSILGGHAKDHFVTLFGALTSPPAKSLRVSRLRSLETFIIAYLSLLER